jgi:hypothetical protein
MPEYGAADDSAVPLNTLTFGEASMSTEKHSIVLVLGEPYASRFWQRVQKTASCWYWVGAINNVGYGNFGMGPRGHAVTFAAHKLSYLMHKGPVPPGLVLDHLCRQRACVNPAHLRPQTRRQNVLNGLRVSHNAWKTHCVHGHSLHEAFLRERHEPGKEGQLKRVCRTCSKERCRRWWRGQHPQRGI